MTTLSYAVVRLGLDWCIVGPRGRIGCFACSEEAIAVGARLTSQALEAGLSAELLVQSSVGQLLPFELHSEVKAVDALPAFLSDQKASSPSGECTLQNS